VDPSQKRGLSPFLGSGLRGLLGSGESFKNNSYMQFSKIKGRGIAGSAFFIIGFQMEKSTRMFGKVGWITYNTYKE
jgi:hypothetical protein